MSSLMSATDAQLQIAGSCTDVDDQGNYGGGTHPGGFDGIPTKF